MTGPGVAENAAILSFCPEGKRSGVGSAAQRWEQSDPAAAKSRVVSGERGERVCGSGRQLDRGARVAGELREVVQLAAAEEKLPDVHVAGSGGAQVAR